MKKILVPTDFSKNARQALEYALSLARAFDSEICLVHTFKLAMRAGSFIAIEQQMRQEAKEEMAKWVAKYERDRPIQSRIIKDTPIRGIGRVAKSYGADLIVMGTKGASGIAGIFVGSTTNGLIKHTRIPLLAIPEAAEFKPIQRIVFAMDTKGISKTAVLDVLRQLIRPWKTHLQILQIVAKDQKGALHPSFKKALKTIDHEIAFEENETGINEGITEYLENHKSDMLCLIKRHRSFLENLFHTSITRQEAFHAHLPLLILHDKV